MLRFLFYRCGNQDSEGVSALAKDTQLVKISLTSNSILLDFPGRLRFCISNAGVAGLIPGRRTKIPHAVWQGKPPPHQNTYFLND